jgi:SAM-dependent methyltransferase
LCALNTSNLPIPRWNAYSTTIHSEEHEGHLKAKKADILVAGCGTGREAIELASVFPKAKVLAVDLSLSSLAYASQKAAEFGLKNITFRQADISNLHRITDKFDFIACSGVLHHMKDVFPGWKTLANLLKSQGVMRIALYSNLAREPINEARAAHCKKRFYGRSSRHARFPAGRQKNCSKKEPINKSRVPKITMRCRNAGICYFMFRKINAICLKSMIICKNSPYAFWDSMRLHNC